MDDSDDDLMVTLNMDNPMVREIYEFVQNATPEAVNAWTCRVARRGEFDNAMESIGSLTRYRRKMVARALVRMFRAGYRCGHLHGYLTGRGDATDGR